MSIPAASPKTETQRGIATGTNTGDPESDPGSIPDLPPSLESALVESTLATESSATENTAPAANTDTANTVAREPRESIYVELLQDMICTALGGESHLFMPDEIECFSAFVLLDCELLLTDAARYLFVRLLQRKREWHRVDKLDCPGDIQAACYALCRPFTQPGDLYRFAAGDAELAMAPRLALLTLDELRTISKRLGIARHNTRDAVVSALLAPPSHLPLFSALSREERLEREVSAFLPHGCIRLDDAVFSLFDRLELVYYRGRPTIGSMLTSAVLARTRRCHFPEYTLRRSTDIFPSRMHVFRLRNALDHETSMESLLEERTADATRRGVALLDTAWPIWEHAVRELWIAYPGGLPRAEYGRMRYHYGWVYTRIIHKACECLARLRLASREEAVLRALLSQRFFRRGRRGAWYERLAIIAARDSGKKEALGVCLDAISDPDVHVINMYALQRRIERLETQMRVPLAQKHHFTSVLREAPTVEFTAVRGDQRGMWLGRDGECSVEHYCLEQYEKQGFRGIHDEGAGLLFVFVLLMWDVLFQPLPGAFETAYQREPLDLASDVFYASRRHAIDERLDEIAHGKAVDLLRATDMSERRKRTWAVACRWEDYSREDLETIAHGLGGRSLAHICRILAQEWSTRTSGLPDLMLWKPGIVTFCEVKAPGDRLSESQRVWIDALLAGGVHVEIARVRS